MPRRSASYRHLPTSYPDFVRRSKAPDFGVDVCVVQVAAPDEEDRFSLGLAGEFTPLIAARAKRVTALVGPAMPAVGGFACIERTRLHRWA